MLKNKPANVGNRGLIPGSGRSPREGNETYSSVFSREIPWTERSVVGYYPQGPKRVGCNLATAAAAKSLQSCLILCDPIDGSPPGSPVPGILQARTLEQVAISFSNAWKWKVKVKSLSRVRLLATPWTTAYQAPPSVGFFQARVLEWGAIAFSELSN